MDSPLISKGRLGSVSIPHCSIAFSILQMQYSQAPQEIVNYHLLSGLGVLEGQSITAAFAEYRKKFIAIYTVSMQRAASL